MYIIKGFVNILNGTTINWFRNLIKWFSTEVEETFSFLCNVCESIILQKG